MPTIVLPGDGRLAIYPTVKTRYPGPGFGIGAGVRPVPSHTDWKANQQVMGMPHPLGGMSLRILKRGTDVRPFSMGMRNGIRWYRSFLQAIYRSWRVSVCQDQ